MNEQNESKLSESTKQASENNSPLSGEVGVRPNFLPFKLIGDKITDAKRMHVWLDSFPKPIPRLFFYQPYKKFVNGKFKLHWTNFTYIVNFPNFKISWNCDTDFGYWFAFGFERNNKRKAWICCKPLIVLNWKMIKLSINKQGILQSIKNRFKLDASELRNVS